MRNYVVGAYGAMQILPVTWEGETWWSAHDRRYADYDPWAEFEQPSTSHLVIELHPHKLIRYTPCGVTLCAYQDNENNPKTLLLSWTRQWASPTQTEALEHLIARKKKHVAMCEARMHRAQQHQKAAEYFLERIKSNAA